MPRNKDLKRLVRARMQKTGEAYTTARARILSKPPKRTRRSGITSSATMPAPAPASSPSVDYAKIAGKSDEVMKERTGCTWERWVYALDRLRAHELPHREIAKRIREKYHLNDWWAQTVTVGYERIRGLRAVGQRRDGSWEAHKSRTLNVPIATLYRAWSDAKVRRQWLRDDVTVRSSSANKAMRLGWPDGTIVSIGFMAKGESKSAVAVQHMRLPDRETADRLKKYWAERLDVLAERLSKAKS